MPMLLTPIEARILGSLVEKSLTTPDQYPLSLNGLVNACNQISNRDPLMKLDETAVARSLSTLQEKGLVGRRSEPGSRVTKFMHHVEVLIQGGNSKEVGVICVLLLRGPQTTGQLKTRTERLCEFTDPTEVENVLQDLAGQRAEPWVVRLAREPGQKEARYMHLFFGTPQVAKSPVADAPPAVKPAAARAPDRIESLEARIARLESQMKELQSKQGENARHESSSEL